MTSLALRERKHTYCQFLAAPQEGGICLSAVSSELEKCQRRQRTLAKAVRDKLTWSVRDTIGDSRVWVERKRCSHVQQKTSCFPSSLSLPLCSIFLCPHKAALQRGWEEKQKTRDLGVRQQDLKECMEILERQLSEDLVVKLRDGTMRTKTGQQNGL